MHARIPGSRLVVIPSASHLSNVEQAEVFNRHLTEFLAG
jgi:pimeloyl-ACP methyl ester carboxylesterase